MNDANRGDAIRNKAEDFIQRVKSLTPGERALLKRNAGCRLSESRGALPLFYRLCPRSIPEWEEDIWFLIACLCCLDRSEKEAEERSFARSLLDFLGKDGFEADGANGWQRKVTKLLDASQEELFYRLPQVVKRLVDNRVPIDWAGLLTDLRIWHWKSRIVQKRWAREFFGSKSNGTGEEQENDGGDN
ncbi:crispr-associated protein, ct1973 family, putative [Heliomicrobium modesticaldum Ice1]|uniref:Crispr-associated protein, ct1973 family, putative n=1 Tax=Heliobacterium modesticaldum (strain ATCC 51547 / Ice1) TaxID=498761 RepID=B0TDT9_HELMI|nr:type I-E CRISPR-associated protein Cse2/CasB [Heliomicrobium modesticaldum]ABZ82802.1 crispr-associated protein, ct1973 family, putative [Heliomicrobium modesticaldum Ice1]